MHSFIVSIFRFDFQNFRKYETRSRYKEPNILALQIYKKKKKREEKRKKIERKFLFGVLKWEKIFTILKFSEI